MIKSVEELQVSGKRVFTRVDFNVPLKHDADGAKVADDTRIREALPTIKYLMEKGAKVILASHMGRPDGRDPKLSLEPVATHLSGLLGAEVLLTDDCVGDGIEMIVKYLKASQVILLENLRYHKEEEENDSAFAHALAGLAEVYVTDAFGTAHRKHASTYGVPSIMPVRGCGFLIKKELRFLNKLLESPEHPYVAVLGGSKVSDKIKTIENLFMRADTMLIAGAMAHAFNLASDSGFKLPANAKKPKPDEVEYAKILIGKARAKDVKLLLPADDVDSFDIGPRTIELFRAELRKARTVFWNGPVGMFEKPEYAKGSMAVAAAMAESPGLKVVGGGETVAAVNMAGVAARLDHISTGGGATLEFLEGNGLPGLDILDTFTKKTQPGALT
ncbi:MAG: phosphoglycerate kinase [Deltaproteobacteria bacterium]|nr:phosphoglycerate kinase [Deltaproteobacteria bacterium]